METFLIVMSCIATLIVGIVVLISKAKKQDLAAWKVGDKLTLGFNTFIGAPKRNKGIERAILKAWSHEEVIISIEDNFYKVAYSDIANNKSKDFREMEERIRKTMNKPDLDLSELTNNKEARPGMSFLDGKHVELLTEIECQVYLKKALDADQFEVASKIRDRMKNFR